MTATGNLMRKFLAFAATMLAVSLLAGCSQPLGSGVDSLTTSSASEEFSANDVMFAQMMIPHHQQAIDMSEMAPSRAQSPAVLELAVEILNEQGPEISQMNRWLEKAGANSHMGHDAQDMGMGSMLSDQEMLELEAATGAEFDKKFLTGMIAHHEGAIQMAQMILDSENPEAKSLAEAIVESQTNQIAQMKAMLADLG